MREDRSRFRGVFEVPNALVAEGAEVISWIVLEMDWVEVGDLLKQDECGGFKEH